MPVALTFPGVYVEEIPSGVRPISGVATSIAAFVGRTVKGPTDRPVTITSWPDFERTFGGLDVGCPLGFAVSDFYLNGGTTAIIVRVFKSGSSQVAQFDAKSLALQASSPGTWANTVRVRVTFAPDPSQLADLATQLGVATSDFFNLTIHDTKSGAEETFNNLTAASSARQVTGILAGQSQLVRTNGAPTKPTAAHAAPAAGKTFWDDDNASSKVTAAVTDSGALTGLADFGDEAAGTGLYQLAHADLFNLLCIPADTFDGDLPVGLGAKAAAYCVKRRALYIADPPSTWSSVSAVNPTDLGITGTDARNAAVYFPRLLEPNPLHGGQLETFVPCGAIAGIMARTDVARGVWKAPAGVDASLSGASGLSVGSGVPFTMNDDENGQLNPVAVNCLRTFPIVGNIVWGARTLRGADILGDDYKYVPVRRTALFIEESLFRGLKWVVFEPNDEPLWAQIRLNVGAFMQGLFRQGAFQGTSARDAYFVVCDKTTTTQNDINLGIVNILVGFAPLKPAEFVVLKIQQIAGQVQT